ncbi:MAG: ROK family protein [Treponemataceae bacterium]
MPSGNEPLILAVDSGGSFVKYALCRPDGRPEPGSLGSLPVDSGSAADPILSVFASVFARASSYADSISGSIIAVGVSTPGPFDFEGGRSLMRHKFASIFGLSLRPYFAGGTDLPVVFEQDAVAFLLGEQGVGAAQGFSNVAACTLGTGLGYACMRRGQVLRNELGSPHLGLYKVPLREGVAEDYVSGRGIVKRWRAVCGPDQADLSVKEIGALAEAGNEVAAAVYADTGRYLGEALFTEVTMRETECLVLGGQISRSFDLMGPSLGQALSGCPSLKKICRAEHIDYAALIGAALKAAKMEEVIR